MKKLLILIPAILLMTGCASLRDYTSRIKFKAPTVVDLIKFVEIEPEADSDEGEE